MGAGIIICGLNGPGKSTLGRALAEKLGYYFIDSEDLYFPKTDPGYLYAAPRGREEAETLLFREIQAHENFVFASVTGDYGERITPFFRCAVLLAAPKDIRMRRVRDRSCRKFDGRMMPGGDLYQREEGFFALVASRPEDTAETWARSLACPVLRADGTRPVGENINFIIERM